MASKLNSEFNYRTQVVGETVWEKIKTLKGFLEGRVRAAALEQVAVLKHEALREEIMYNISENLPHHLTLRLKAELLELESHLPAQQEAFALNHEEIAILRRLLAEYYAVAEPSRIDGYTDDQMFEANAELEFTVWIGKEIFAEIVAHGRPSPARLRNAMSSPAAFRKLQAIGLIPAGDLAQTDLLLTGDVDVPLLTCGEPVQ